MRYWLALFTLSALLLGAPATAQTPAAVNGCVYISGGITLSNGQRTAFQCDVNGKLLTTGGGGGVTSVSNSDGTLTISPTTGAVVASLALGHANTWTGQQTFVAPVLGTPASGNAANLTGLPIAGIAGLGTNVATALGTALNGTGALVGTTGAALIAPTASTMAIGGATLGSNALSVTGSVANTGGAVFLAGSVSSTTWNTMGGSLVIDITHNFDGNSANFTNHGSGAIGWASGAVGPSSPTQVLSLWKDASNILAQRIGTAAQTSRVYNTFTDASNYERGVLDWTTSSNVFTVGAQAAGTGTLRGVNFVGASVAINGTAAVSCAAASVSLVTLVVTNGFVTHC